MQSLSWIRCFGHGSFVGRERWGLYFMRHLYDVDTYAVVGFEYVACLTTCTNSDAHILIILVAGLTTGTNSNANLWWQGLTMCTILCVVWRGFGFGLAAPISSSLSPPYILSVIQGCGGRLLAGPRIKNVKYRADAWY